MKNYILALAIIGLTISLPVQADGVPACAAKDRGFLSEDAYCGGENFHCIEGYADFSLAGFGMGLSGNPSGELDAEMFCDQDQELECESFFISCSKEKSGFSTHSFMSCEAEFTPFSSIYSQVAVVCSTTLRETDVTQTQGTETDMEIPRLDPAPPCVSFECMSPPANGIALLWDSVSGLAVSNCRDGVCTPGEGKILELSNGRIRILNV